MTDEQKTLMTTEELHDFLCTALDFGYGGSEYWCKVHRGVVKPDAKFWWLDWVLQDDGSIFIAHGDELDGEEPDDDEDEIALSEKQEITTVFLLKRIEEIAKIETPVCTVFVEGRYSKLNGAQLIRHQAETGGDAESADCLWQLVCLGSLVYG